MNSVLSNPATWAAVVGALGGALIGQIFNFLRHRTSAADAAYAGQIDDLKADNRRLHATQDELRAKYEAMLVKLAELSVEVRDIRAERDRLLTEKMQLVAEKSALAKEHEHCAADLKKSEDSNAELLMQIEVVAKERDDLKQKYEPDAKPHTPKP